MLIADMAHLHEAELWHTVATMAVSPTITLFYLRITKHIIL
jgi:hypothetical protein